MVFYIQEMLAAQRILSSPCGGRLETEKTKITMFSSTEYELAYQAFKPASPSSPREE